MRVTVEDEGGALPSGVRARVRDQLLVALGPLASRARSVVVRLSRTEDARGEVLCGVRIVLDHGTVAEATVFETSVDHALDRAILRVARAASRRIEESKG